jgi:hypothetical protein
MKLEKREKPVRIGWRRSWEADTPGGQVYFCRSYQVWKWKLNLWRRPVSGWGKRY